MADQTPDPTALDDDQLDDLLDRLAERANERDDLDLPGGGASRRSVLAGLLGLGGAAAGAGVASAIGENESYGSSAGVVGTDSEPLNEANVQDLHAQDAQIDNTLETEQLLAKSIDGIGVRASEFASLQDAVDKAGDNETVFVNSAFNEDVTIPNNGLRLVGSGRDQGSTVINGKLTVTGINCIIDGLHLNPSSGLALKLNGFKSQVVNCEIESDVEVGPTNLQKIIRCDINGNDLTVVSSSTRTVIALNARASITDNGSETVVSLNA